MSKKKKSVKPNRGELKNQEATVETLRKAAENPDPVLEMRDKGLLHSGLEDSVHLIRSAIEYLSSANGYQVSDYTRVFDPSGGAPTDDENEPAEVRRYLNWSSIVINRWGSGGMNLIRNTIIGGRRCDPGLFVMMVKLF
jgi:hypothetical protein